MSTMRNIINRKSDFDIKSAANKRLSKSGPVKVNPTNNTKRVGGKFGTGAISGVASRPVHTSSKRAGSNTDSPMNSQIPRNRKYMLRNEGQIHGPGPRG